MTDAELIAALLDLHARSGKKWSVHKAPAARIEALTAGGWRPIETAPKDGTPILAWAWDGCGHVVIWWDDDGRRPWTSTTGETFAEDVTHWQPVPLPPPPATDEVQP